MSQSNIGELIAKWDAGDRKLLDDVYVRGYNAGLEAAAKLARRNWAKWDSEHIARAIRNLKK